MSLTYRPCKIIGIRIFLNKHKMGALSIIMLLVGVASAISINEVTGPDRALFIGDYEPFSCRSSSSPNLKWIYKFKHTENEVLDSDILRDKRTSDGEDESFRKSLIRIPHDLQSILCVDASKKSEVGHVSVDVNEFSDVDLLEEPTCDHVPKITLRRWDQSSSNHVWFSHYITNQDVSLKGVSGIKLTCISKSKVNWTISQKKLMGFRYYTSEKKDTGCHVASLVLSPINPTSAQKFTCVTKGQPKVESTVNILLAPTRYSDDNVVLDFNKTQECIEYLGTTVFGSQTLAWTTTGSSLLSIGMMVGIVFLKKQLDKQQTNNPGGPEPVPA